MRIIYSVAGEGMGHAVRSRVIIEQLQKQHEVKVFAAGKAISYLSQHFKEVTPLKSMKIFYVNNKVSNLLTALLTAARLPFMIFSFLKISICYARYKPNFLITDFEAVSNYAAQLFRIPVIAIDNNCFVTQTKFDYPKKNFASYLKTFIAVKIVSPTANYYLIPAFFQATPKKENVVLTAPVLREEVKGLKTANGKHILVYQTTKTNKKLLRCLKQIGERFVVYGFEKEKTDANLVFKKFNEKEFYKELATSKAVILNGGFTLMTEALFLKKPILAFPIKGQFEQVVNAHHLEKMKLGMKSEKTETKKIKQFLQKIPEYKKNLKQFKFNNPDTVEELQKVIDCSNQK